MATVEPLSCPFCGNNYIYVHRINSKQEVSFIKKSFTDGRKKTVSGSLVLGYRVGCPKCNIVIECVPSKVIGTARLRRICIELWNLRVEMKRNLEYISSHLLPCPICGNVDLVIEKNTEDGPWYPSTSRVRVIHCELCSIRRLFPADTTLQDMRKAWNARVYLNTISYQEKMKVQDKINGIKADLANPQKRNLSRKKISQLPQVALGGIAKEDLPFPYVHYPPHYGTFIAFSRSPNSKLYLCECARPAVQNLVKFLNSGLNNLVNAEVPLLLVNQIGSLANSEAIPFKKHLCHRCNLSTPQRRYCHEMYGENFKQYYWWYVSQAFLRMGIYPRDIRFPSPFPFLEDICPDEFQKEIFSIRDIAQQYKRELDKINGRPFYESIPEGEKLYIANANHTDAAEMIRLRKEEARACRNLTKKIEDTVRQEFGFRRVGEGWVSESILANIVRRVLPELEMIRHCRPDWLEGLELDIYIPSLKLGIEYQGQQHYYPVEAWGGIVALKLLQKRDKRKRILCRTQGVSLLEVTYMDPLNEDFVRNLLSEYIPDNRNG